MSKQAQQIVAFLIVILCLAGCTHQAKQSYFVSEDTVGQTQYAEFTTNKQSVDSINKTQISHNIKFSEEDIVCCGHVSTTAPAVINADKVSLIIDSGSVSHDVEISIIATDRDHSGDIPDHLANLTADGVVYRMLPDGQHFDRDITIAMSYDSTALPYGYTADDIYTFFYNEKTHLWQQVERDSVDTENQIIYSRTNHFTDYINGVLKVPESNDAMAYTPTSIKELKAADPMEGITLIAPPEANNMGTANLTYPIQIPAGRRGMQPNLAVTYNSAGGSGILGLGWSLPISEISVDTRRGVPLYSDSLETETYTLDGEVLVTAYTDDNDLLHLNKPAYATPWKPRNLNGNTQFYPRVEGAFRRIIRHGTSPADYYWVVTDKNGTKYYYGDTDSSCLKGPQGNIARWCLTRIVDTYGNKISYSYVPYTYNVPNSTNAGIQLLLSKINYTGHAQSSERGRYNIHFFYAQDEKIDAVTSARFGFLEADASLLDHITITFDNQQVKNYVFGYKQGAFGRTLLCNIIEADPSAYTSVCSECLGTEVKGSYSYHEPSINFCGDESFFDSMALIRQSRAGDTNAYIYSDTIPFFDLCISDSTDYYSDHGIVGDTLLSSVFSRDVYSRCSETDSSCKHPAYTEHRFTYSDIPLFMLSPTEYITNEDRSQDNIKGSLFLVEVTPGPIEGTGTRSWNIGGAVDAGFGLNTFIKSISLGGSYTYSRSKSEGLISLVDLNGDGFSDKIYKRGNDIYYRLRNASEYNRFLEEHLITGLKDFLHSTSVGNSWGLEGSVGADGMGVSFGLNWSDGNSSTTTYFSDMNGDGLPDIVHNGIVLYNHIDEVESDVFVPATPGVEYMIVSSCNRIDTIYIGEPVVEDIFADFVDSTIMICDTINEDGKIPHIECYPYSYTSPRPYTPNLENVRFWQAPQPGYVHITDSARLLQSTLTLGDGVRLIVQHHDRIISSDTLLPNMDTAFLDTVIYVTVGERIYFRVQSMNTRTADRLMWNPTITYCDSLGSTSDSRVTNDVGQDMYRYSYEKDFLLSGLQKIKMPFDVDVHIEAMVYDSINSYPANYVRLQVLVNGNNWWEVPIGSGPFLDTVNFSLNKWDSLQVRIVADDDINWSNIESQCRIYFTHNNATDSDSLFPCIDTLSYEDSIIYLFSYYPQIQKLVYSTDTDLNTVRMYPGYSARDYSKFGTMYRNWGQFGYKAPSNSASDILQESLLNDTTLTSIQGTGQSSYESISDGATLNLNTEDQESTATIDNKAAYNPLASSFFVMQPDFKHGCWTAYSDYAYIERSMLSNLPHPADGLSITQTDSSDFESSMPIYTPGAVAVNKKTFNSSFGVSGNVNAKIKELGWSGSSSFTKSQSRQLSDMLDLNGDGFPDVLSEVKVQYSQPFGGLSKKTGNLFIDNLYSEYSLDTVYGGSFGGSAVHMLWQPANNTRRSSKSISGNVGANLGGTLGQGGSATTWVDINGDGLPDKVYCDGADLYYYQNVGYGLLSRTLFSKGSARHSSSKGFSGGASLGNSFDHTWLNQEGAALDDFANSLPDSLRGLADRIHRLLGDQKFNNKLNVSITAGFGASYSENTTDVLTMDINGDGLPDRVEKYGGAYHIQFNNGNGFGWSNAVLHLAKDIDNVSYSTDLTSAITVGVTLGFIPLKIEGNPKGGLSRSLSRTEAQWADMNGDGIPDYIWDAGDGYIGVRYSHLGEANRLTHVELPSGGTYLIGYKLNDDGTESNMRHYVMSSLTVKDNRMHSPDQCRRFEYGSRHYDRLEREDYGYSDVVTIEDSARRLDYRRTVQQYHNQDYLFRGLCHSTAVISGATNDTLSSTRQEYRLFEIESGNLIQGSKPGCYGDGFPAVLSDSTIYYDGGQRQIVSRLRFGYTTLGNIDTVYDDGALNDPNDDYIAATSYSNLNDYISVVSQEQVLNNSSILRYREASYYPTGAIQTLTFQNGASSDAVYDFSYDIYGNIIEITQPENHQHQRFHIRYVYDSEVHLLPVETSNDYGLSSYAKYDYRWQKPIWTKSANDAQAKYRYDEQGRLEELYAPFEYGSSHPTIRYEYYDRYPQTDAYWRHCLLWARTLNDNGSNYIPTVTISDGLGRPRVVKKEASVNGQVKRIISGYAEIDALGRKVREYYPDIEDTIHPDSTFNSRFSTPRSRFFYDELDRVTKTIYPDGTFSTTRHTVGNDAFGVLRLRTDATDQNGHTSNIYSSVREQNTTSVNPIGATTKFVYDHIGQLSMTISPDGDSTQYAYDLVGRRTDRFHPSAGHTHWDYDAAGNLILQTQNNGEWISYTYDYSRPTHISYSSRPWNDVWYEYGAAGSGTQSGRIVRMQDATGVQSMEYDDMGNMVFNRHTYVQPHSPNALTLSTEWKYDSWGRLLEITYPDLEKVYYHYDLGGALTSVKGFKPGVVDSTFYIRDIRYDHFGQRTYILDGDSVETRYQYEPYTRRLSHLVNYSHLANEVLQDNKYEYDNVGNVISIQDGGRNPRIQTFSYDAANRLIRSEGDIPQEYSSSAPLSYKTQLSYSPAGKLLSKSVDSRRLSTTRGLFPVFYDNSYHYNDPNNPYAVTSIHDSYGANYDFNWDANGNLELSYAHATHTKRYLCWTEDNRLQAFMEKGNNGDIAAYYNYTAEGERNLKLTSPRINIQQNAALLNKPTLMFPTLYASPLITLNKHGYTKHYFEEGRRICSKIGGGFLNVRIEEINDPVSSFDFDYDDLHHQQKEGVLETFNSCFVAEPQIDRGIDLHQMLVEQETARDEQEPAFYYHSDHLGSAAYLTNNGRVTQTLNYLPYGEDWVDIQHYVSARYSNMELYTFTGKEKDSESGYHYFGARYYDSEALSGWLSVDPMADKYPSLSPYNYCAWNPVKLVDPDGRDWYMNENTGAVYYNTKIRGKKAAGTGTMKGEGWKYMGPNGMFMKDDYDYEHFDLSLVKQNGGSYSLKNGFSGEIMLNGSKAKDFMKSQGYKIVPTQVISYNNTYTEDYQTGPSSVHITYGEHFEYIEKVGYVPNNFTESRRSNIGNTYYSKFDGSLGHGRVPYVERQSIAYSEISNYQNFFHFFFGAYLTIGHGMHDYVDRRTFGRYNGGNKYIDAFLNY